MDNVASPPFWRMAQRANGQTTTRDCRPLAGVPLLAAEPCMIEVGVARAGTGGRYAPGRNLHQRAVVVDFITPETETSHWYFWGMARQFRPMTPD